MSLCFGFVATVRDAPIRFGACSARDYFILTRICMVQFIQTLQKYPKKPCRLVHCFLIGIGEGREGGYCYREMMKPFFWNLDITMFPMTLTLFRFFFSWICLGYCIWNLEAPSLPLSGFFSLHLGWTPQPHCVNIVKWSSSNQTLNIIYVPFAIFGYLFTVSRIDHFRSLSHGILTISITFCLCVKTGLCVKPFIWKCFHLQVHFQANEVLRIN